MRTSTVIGLLGLSAVALAAPTSTSGITIMTITSTVSSCPNSSATGTAIGGGSGSGVVGTSSGHSPASSASSSKATSASPSAASQPASGPGSPQSINNLKDKIKHVVHIILENRSFDNILGGFTIGDMDTAARNGPFCNPANTTDPNSQVFCAGPKDYDVITNDPDHSVTGNNFEFFSTFHPSDADILSGKLTPNNNGFIENQIRKYGKSPNNATYDATQVMNYYLPEQIPVISSLVNNFVTFDKWFSCIPGVGLVMSNR